MNVIVKEAIQEASDILLNEVGDNLLNGIYWALVPSDSEYITEYNTHYGKILDAGFSNGKIMSRYNKLVRKGTVFTFKEITVVEFMKSLYPTNGERGDYFAKKVVASIKGHKAKEIKECAKYLRHLYVEKHLKDATIGIFNTTQDRVNSREFQVESGKYAGKRVIEHYFSYGIDIKDIVTLNREYLNLFGFKISKVNFLDMPNYACCLVRLHLESIESEDEGVSVDINFEETTEVSKTSKPNVASNVEKPIKESPKLSLNKADEISKANDITYEEDGDIPDLEEDADYDIELDEE